MEGGVAFSFPGNFTGRYLNSWIGIRPGRERSQEAHEAREFINDGEFRVSLTQSESLLRKLAWEKRKGEKIVFWVGLIQKEYHLG